ncbi:sorting nexin 1 [Micractinium conductrix]|uniref:Sorting nexin 1 n=1 Tax=Micractinium conductrix TaxID=554055 RepID=A0A2P6VDH6_9CHLO|nr:sorting nexin 1 [Micractinium conductrix]|eukprot:PSC72138.1 sorting nexin 1 [Micractinium conductrix]
MHPTFGAAGPLGGAEDAFGEQVPLADEPPPYHSVVLQSTVEPASTSGRDTGSGSYGVPANSEFEIRVADPVRQGEGVAAYVSYKVLTRTSAPGYREAAEVIRRFRDFVWLQKKLRREHPGVIVPALPEKNVVEKYKMTGEFIESRRAALTIFVNRVAAHPILKRSPDLQLFLEASETEFGIEVSRSGMEDPAVVQGAAKKTLSGAVSFLKELSHTASNLYHKRTDDEEEEAEYLKIRVYVYELERHLGEAQRQAGRLVRHQAELGEAVKEFGAAMGTLGRYEDAGLVGDSFGQLGERAQAVSALCGQTSESLATSFEAPLKEFVRTVAAVKKVMARRSAALAAYQQARADVDARRTRLAKLRGTPGIREERVAEAERDLSAAQQGAEAAKAAYEAIVQQMGPELDRFQRERAREMGYVLRDFAVVQARLSGDTARLWASLVPGLAAAAAGGGHGGATAS